MYFIHTYMHYEHTNKHTATDVYKTLKGGMTAVLGDRWYLKVGHAGIYGWNWLMCRWCNWKSQSSRVDQSVQSVGDSVVVASACHQIPPIHKLAHTKQQPTGGPAPDRHRHRVPQPPAHPA